MPSKKNQLLIICDSHGIDWGCIGYATLTKNYLERNENWEVTIAAYPGISLKKASTSIKQHLEKKYDSIIIGLGNPDIHPRTPKKLVSTLKKIGIRSARDSYFSIPPFICFSYFARMPLFLLRLALIRIFKRTYLSQEEIKSFLTEIIDEANSNTNSTNIIPTLKVNAKIYGKDHNLRSIDINDFLHKKYSTDIINIPGNDKHNIDFFHYRQEFHTSLSNAIIEKIINYDYN